MKKIITLLMCLICCCSYAFLYEGNGGDWLSEDVAVGSGGGFPSFDPSNPFAYITFYIAGTQTKISTDYQVNIGKKFNLSAIPMSRIGYDFVNYTDSSGNVITEITPTIEGEEIKVYTNWSVHVWQIEWVLTDYSTSPTTVTRNTTSVEYGSIITPSIPTDIPERYEFFGWDNPQTMPDRNIICNGEINISPVYGILTKSDGTAEYTDDAIGMQPVSLLTYNTYSFGDWKNFIDNFFTPVMLYSNGQEAYELDRNDLSKKVDGTASDIANENFDGNAMVRIKKFYISVSNNNGSTTELKIKISARKQDSSYTCYGFVDSNGTERDCAYLSIYNASLVNNKLRSLKNQNRAEFAMGTNGYQSAVDAAKTNGSGWSINNYALNNAIRIFLMVISKSGGDDIGLYCLTEQSITQNSSSEYGKVSGNTGDNNGGFKPRINLSDSIMVLWFEDLFYSFYPEYLNGCRAMGARLYYKLTEPYGDISDYITGYTDSNIDFMASHNTYIPNSVTALDNIIVPNGFSNDSSLASVHRSLLGRPSSTLQESSTGSSIKNVVLGNVGTLWYRYSHYCSMFSMYLGSSNPAGSDPTFNRIRARLCYLQQPTLMMMSAPRMMSESRQQEPEEPIEEIATLTSDIGD